MPSGSGSGEVTGVLPTTLPSTRISAAGTLHSTVKNARSGTSASVIVAELPPEMSNSSSRVW